MLPKADGPCAVVDISLFASALDDCSSGGAANRERGDLTHTKRQQT
jgi:hypothetical protein